MQGTGRKGGRTWEKPILDGLYVLSRVLAGSSCVGPGNLCLGTSTLRTQSGAHRAARRRRAKPGWAQGLDAAAAGLTVQEMKCATQPGPSVCSRGSRGLKVEGLGGPSFKGWTWNDRGCCRVGGLRLLKRPRRAERCHRSTHPLCLWFPGSPVPSPGWPAVTSVRPWPPFLVRPSGEAACFYHLLSSRPQPLPGFPSAPRQAVDILSPTLSLDSELTCFYHVHTPHPQAVYPPSQMEGSGGPLPPPEHPQPSGRICVSIPPGAVFVSGRGLCVSGEIVFTHIDESTWMGEFKRAHDSYNFICTAPPLSQTHTLSKTTRARSLLPARTHQASRSTAVRMSSAYGVRQT